MKRPFLFVFALTALATASACTVSDPTDDAVATADAELRVPKAGELLGDITYGETKSVSYTEVPTFRAFRLAGKQGDVVDAWARTTTGGDARLWVVRQDGATLAWNDDADATTADAHVVVTLPRTETYYLVLRDANDEENDFEVSLAGGGGPGSPVPAERLGTSATVLAQCSFFVEWHHLPNVGGCQQFGAGWNEEVELDVAVGGTAEKPELTVRAFSREREVATWGEKKKIDWADTTIALDPATGRGTSKRQFNRPPQGRFCDSMTKGPRTFVGSVTGDKITFDMFESLQTNACCAADERRAQCTATLPQL